MIIKDITNVIDAIKAFLHQATLRFIKELFTLEKTFLFVIFAKRVSVNRVILKLIEELTLEKNLMSVRFARGDLINWVSMRDIKGFIHEKDLLSVGYVTKTFLN